MSSEAKQPAKESQSDSPSVFASSTRSESLGSSPPGEAPTLVSSVINSVNKQVAADRRDHIKRRMEENRRKITDITGNFLKLAQERRYLKGGESTASADLLTKRQQEAVDMQNRIDTSNGRNANKESKESAV